MNKDKIYNELIPTLVEKIVSAYQPEKVILFGSYAYGNPGKDSDIDLVIIKDTKQTSMERWLAVHKILKEYKYISISPLVYTPDEFRRRLELKDFFVLNVVKKGKVFYG